MRKDVLKKFNWNVHLLLLTIGCLFVQPRLLSFAPIRPLCNLRKSNPLIKIRTSNINEKAFLKHLLCNKWFIFFWFVYIYHLNFYFLYNYNFIRLRTIDLEKGQASRKDINLFMMRCTYSSCMINATLRASSPSCQSVEYLSWKLNWSISFEFSAILQVSSCHYLFFYALKPFMSRWTLWHTFAEFLTCCQPGILWELPVRFGKKKTWISVQVRFDDKWQYVIMILFLI